MEAGSEGCCLASSPGLLGARSPKDRLHLAVTSCGFVAFLVVLVAVIVADEGTYKIWADNTPAHNIFVGLVQLVLLCWILSLVTWVWQRQRIPIPLVFGTEAKPWVAANALPHDLRVMACYMTGVVVVAVAVYAGLCWEEARGLARDCKTGSPVPIEFGVYVALLAPFLLPWPLPAWQGRKRLVYRMLQCFSNVFGAPVLGFEVKLIHILITDTLTSSCLLLWDFEYAVCLFTTSSWAHGKGQGSGQGGTCGAGSWNSIWLKPFVVALPFWLRFSQCMWRAWTEKSLKEAANAAKYITAMAVVASSAAQVWHPAQHETWFTIWIACLVVKTTYCFYWDVVHDWGLVQVGWHAPKVRAHMMYSHWVYVVAVIFNFFGRISWSLAISPRFCTASCRLTVGLLEILRRGLWLVLRVEWECVVRFGKSSAENLLATSIQHSGGGAHPLLGYGSYDKQRAEGPGLNAYEDPLVTALMMPPRPSPIVQRNVKPTRNIYDD